MLDACGVSSPEELFAHLPEAVRLNRPLNLAPGISEYEIVEYFRDRAAECANGYASFLGAGVYNHYRPVLVDTVVSRGEFLTSYTPYQAEIAQGTLTTIFEFQTMICQLTGMDVANASMYDGSTGRARGRHDGGARHRQGPRADREKRAPRVSRSARHLRQTSRHAGRGVRLRGRIRQPRSGRPGAQDGRPHRRGHHPDAEFLRHRGAGEGGGGDRPPSRRAAGSGIHRSRLAGPAGTARRRRYRGRRAAILRHFAELRRTVRRASSRPRKSISGRCRAGWSARPPIRAAIAPSA